MAGGAKFDEVTDWVLSNWDKGSFATVEESVRYHWRRHGMMEGKTPTEYTKDALRYLEGNKDLYGLLVPIKVGGGSLGWRMDKGPGEPLGIYTAEGKVVTFRYIRDIE